MTATYSGSRYSWRDFYYATTYALVDEIEKRWAISELELSHPTGFGWPPDLVATVLEALGHFADADRPKELGLTRVHLSCLHDLSETDVRRAMETLNEEQDSTDQSVHRRLDIRPIPLASVGLGEVPGATLLRIGLVNRRESN